MKSVDIRNSFIKFFLDKNHKIVSSSAMVIKDDPTLMFTNAQNLFALFYTETETYMIQLSSIQRISGYVSTIHRLNVTCFASQKFEMQTCGVGLSIGSRCNWCREG